MTLTSSSPYRALLFSVRIFGPVGGGWWPWYRTRGLLERLQQVLDP